MAKQRITHMKRLTGVGATWQQGSGPSANRVRVELHAGGATSYWFSFGDVGAVVARDGYVDMGYNSWPRIFDRDIHGDIVTQSLHFHSNVGADVTWVEVFEVDIPDLTEQVKAEKSRR